MEAVSTAGDIQAAGFHIEIAILMIYDHAVISGIHCDLRLSDAKAVVCPDPVCRSRNGYIPSGDDHIILPDYAMLVAGRYFKRSAAVYRKIIMRKDSSRHFILQSLV